MKSLEDELRELYRAVTDTVREQDLPGLYDKRARPRRRRWFGAFAPLAAAAAVVVAIGVGVAVPKLASSPSPSRSQPAAPAPPASFAPAPPFMIVVRSPGARPLLVVSAATGRTTAQLPVPRAGTAWVGAAATGSPATFVLAATPNRGGLCNPTYLYTVTLSDTGKVASLRPWTDPVVPEEIGSLTASADGGTLAFIYYKCRAAGQEIGVIRGRTTRTWHESQLLAVDSLSLSADGSRLGYTEQSFGGGVGTVRVLDTSSASGNATAASKAVYSFPAIGRADFVVFGAAFTTMDVSWITGFNTFHLAGYRFGAGRVQGALFRQTMSGLEIDRAGGQLMVFNQSISLYLVDPLTGKATLIRTPWLKAWGITW